MQISSSNYIIQQNISIGIVGIVLCLSLIGFAFYRLNKAVKSGDYESKRQSKREMIGAVFLAIAAWIFVFMPGMIKALDLRKNSVEVVGKTIEWISSDDSWDVKYQFVVDGQTYTNQIGTVYGGKTIEKIKCPGGEYFVTYEKDNPTNSVMDFKRPKQ